MGYAGLFNSSYQPGPLELFYISTPNDQLGPVEAGQLVVAVLQGIMLVQYTQYASNSWYEKRWTKWLVHLAFALCFIKFVYVWAFSWDKFISHNGDWAYMSTFTKFSVPIGISSTIPSAVCQVFYIHRCWVLSRNWFFLLPALSSLLLTLGSSIALTYGSAVAAGGNNAVTKLILTSANLTLASTLVCDVFITAFTCFYLIRERTGFKESDGLIMRLVKCSIESAAGPTLVALVNLVLSNKATDNQWFLFPNLALSHVYGASLLYSVNARKTVAQSSQNSSSKPPSRYNEFPLQDRNSRKQGVIVGVSTVVRKDPLAEEPGTGSTGRQSGDGDSFPVSLKSHSKNSYFI